MPYGISLHLGARAAWLGVVAGLAISTTAALAAPCGGDRPLAIGVFGPLTGARKDFGEMALNSVIREINRQGMTILLVEQNAMQALRLGHHGYVLETGQIVASVACETLLHDDRLRDAYLGRHAAAAAAE